MVINLNAFDVGEDVAALVGGTLLNLAARAVSAQATLPPSTRQLVTLVVDEFHTLPGADDEQVLGELAKYGAHMLLATPTLSRLDWLTGSQRTRDLRAAVFSNLNGLFAFLTSAEDATYVAEELGGGLDAQDLVELADFKRACRPDVAGEATTGAGSRRNPAAFIRRALAATVGWPRLPTARGAFHRSRPFAHNGLRFCGSVSGQLGDDRSERVSGVGADDEVGEAALLPSSQDFLDGRRRVTWKYQERVRRAQRGRVRVGGCHERGHGVADYRHVEREFDVSDSAEIGRHPHDLGPRVARHRS